MDKAKVSSSRSNRSSARNRSESQSKKRADARSSSARSTKPSRIEELKRAINKKKADLAFSRTVGDNVPAEEGPRAAVYKGKMGSSHKKAMSMQSEGTSFSLPFNIPFSLPLDKINLSSKKTMAAIVCACVVLSLVLLYTPTKHYYTAIRDQAKAEIAYEIVKTRNEALEKDVALLSSEVGMEDRAREAYGWVKPGENAVTVTGLTDGTEPSAAEILRTVTLNDVHAPETWYSPFLDSVFGYEP